VSVLFIVVPVALALVGAALLAFVWAARQGQFDDVATPAVRALVEDDPPPVPASLSSPVPPCATMPRREGSVSTYLRRLVGAARLDAATYEEVEADRSANGQALLAVVLSSLAAGVGASGGVAGPMGPVVAALGTLVGWLLWAAVVWFVGTRLLPEPQTQSDVGELLRTTGFAAAPGLVRVLGFVPFLGIPVAVLVTFWMLAAMVVAVRQALDYRSTGRALLVCGLGLLAYLGVNVVIGFVLGASQALLGALSGAA
jgi:cbb3-type cytochrome oxidase maturation protein